MTPAQAVSKLRKSGWTYQAIAEAVGAVHPNPRRWEREETEPGWSFGQAVIALAQRGTSRARRRAV